MDMLQTTDTTDSRLVVEFHVAEAAFGIDAKRVLEIVKTGDWTPVHGAPPDVLGIRNLRGRIVTIVDMATHLGMGHIETSERSRLLIMEHQSDYYGFLVDSVSEAIALDEAMISTPPASLNANLRNRLLGVYRKKQELTAILDPEVLFSWNTQSRNA